MRMEADMERKRRQPYKRNKKRIHIAAAVLSVTAAFAAVCGIVYFMRGSGREMREELLVRYMEQIGQQDYEEMYRMTDPAHSAYTDKEAFIKRNSVIYEGIEIDNIRVEVLENDRNNSREQDNVAYRMFFDTLAGNLRFENEMQFTDTEDGYKIIWHDGLIFPELASEDKVRIESSPAERGKILDRNERMLAGPGTASSVGLVPGRLEDRENALHQLSRLLDMDPETIRNCLDAAWVTEDSFVPLKTVPKVSELDLMALDPEEDVLLAIPGVMISDVEVRTYPFGAAAGHLTGYVRNVTTEDLEEHAGEGYNENSVIGKSGLEALFEKELKGQDVRLTIDTQLQEALYQQFQEDPGCSVAMDPCSGEVLALVSTPSFDSNEFILGLSDARWNALNEDERKPLLNRFRQIWCPGSTLKPVIASIGLKTGAVDWQEDFGNEGLSWQKDATWGDYYITTLHAYEPVTMENALIYSDNIYFAKAALGIGADVLERELNIMGFGEQIPFEIVMPPSQYSNTEHIESEIQLADSGYGQGQILVNPLHMAGLYTAFCNGGNALKPRLVYEDEADMDAEDSLLIVSMVENVKEIGGSGYVVSKDRNALDAYWGSGQ